MGAILFSRDINSFNVLANKDVVVSVYSGKKKTSTLIRDESFTRGYAISLEDIVKFVNSQIPANEIIGVVFREKEQMIPELIIRELIVNALMHQDFTKRESKIHISIFQDRIEIENPGQSLVEVDRMIDSQPKTRNVKLSDFMRRVTFCEVKGTGIDKVIEESEKSLLPPPLFYSDEHFTKVTVSAFKEFSKYNKQERLTACYQHCCLKYAQNEYFTNETLRERFGLDKGEYQKVSKVISLAKEENRIVEPEQHKYAPYWAKYSLL